MKKLFITGVVAALAFSSVAQAELEIMGNVTTLYGYQHDDKDAAGAPAGGLTQGDLRWAATADADHSGFAVPQAEIDFENEYGENIMARVDVDFIDLGTPSASGLLLEQAYVTANIGVGNGMEFMIGKYNAPVALESVDRWENTFSTYTPGWQFLQMKQVLGAKLYYEFNDHWDMDLAVVNSLNNVNAGNSAYPSGILRVGAKWGDEDRLSYINVAGAVGPEQSTAVRGVGGSQNKHLDYYGNLWGNWALGDAWDLSWEAIYRQTNSMSGAGANQKAIAGQLYAVYQASDVWTVQARGAALWEINPANARGGSGASLTGTTWSGFEGLTYSGTLGATYQITDGAQMKLEYRFDLADPAGSGANKADYHTGVAEFAYSF